MSSKLPTSMYKQLWDWGVYTKSDMQYLVTLNAFTSQEYEEITGGTYPPTGEELEDTVYTTR